MTHPAPITGVLETCLYASNLDEAEHFYSTVLGLQLFAREPGRHVFFRCGAAMFLIFDPSVTATQPGHVGTVGVPAHGARGSGHVAFAVSERDLSAWRERLAAAAVAIDAEVDWPRGGHSIYVRDPAGNSVELATPAIWGIPASDERG